MLEHLHKVSTTSKLSAVRLSHCRTAGPPSCKQPRNSSSDSANSSSYYGSTSVKDLRSKSFHLMARSDPCKDANNGVRVESVERDRVRKP